MRFGSLIDWGWWAFVLAIFAFTFWYFGSFKDFPWQLKEPVLSRLASLASIYGLLFSTLGLLASAYAAKAVRNVREQLRAKVRLPQLRKDLVSAATEFNRLSAVNEGEEARKAESLSSIASTLKSIKQHGTGNVKTECKIALKSLATFKKQRKNNSGAFGNLTEYWSLYEQLQTVESTIRNYVADMRIS